MSKKKRVKKQSSGQRPPVAKIPQAPPPPVPDRRALEQVMSNLERLIGGRTFNGVEELQQFLDQTLTGSRGKMPRRAARTPIEEAQDLMYEAWEAHGADRVALACRALEISPDCADAYVLLAEETATSLAEARDLYAQGVAAAERALGERPFKKDAGHFWGLISTRPYMRARAGLAQCLWEMGEREAAVDHFQDMLRLNPNDNQGLRFLLSNWLLGLGRDDNLGRLLEDYREDATAAWAYTWALWAFRRQDDSPESRRRLKKALKQNPHVPDYLLGHKRLPRWLPDALGFGDESEAADYAAGAMAIWEGTPGALDWLAAAT